MAKSLYIVLFILLVSAFSVTATDWKSYQSEGTSSGRVAATGAWNMSIETYTTIPQKADFQPVTSDLTGDADLEILSIDGDTLQMHDDEGVLIDDLVLTVTPTTPLTISRNDKILFIADDNLSYVYNYSGGFNYERNTSINKSLFNADSIGATDKNIKCSPTPALYDTCYFMNDFGNVCEWNTLTGGLSCYEAYNTTGVTGNYKAAVGGWMGNHVIFTSLVAIDTLMVFDVETSTLETTFSGDGILDLTAFATRGISNPMINNWNEAGDSEIILNKIDTDAGHTYSSFIILKSDGNQYSGSPFNYEDVTNTGGTPYASDAVLAYADGTKYICGSTRSTPLK